ncbi:uncharacterized protein MONOS_5528 [Monocercomonoides exilis]|uniref:uncharacterized protein n=1 Tax=Monocercomonoides exilis TaxID=2049356 RepID=UPI00355A1F93|nr:hypothetical protein MONOS_5528 [Monocercomonoides exilis]|eukprot:MONOS_5528.1-p1 / transcript=MONOS_5528.1 / gene=MONOS_5528 / organism=Monocercomonoides_exilis_PA203 / gene_product=unspecified product / transcript_product=unspecified product / location=Mono_scaffold00162:38652-41313(-) / protein_length=836 / sequence_SO=supercontig / SO=protein_coding / is_pseudo=false
MLNMNSALVPKNHVEYEKEKMFSDKSVQEKQKSSEAISCSTKFLKDYDLGFFCPSSTITDSSSHFSFSSPRHYPMPDESQKILKGSLQRRLECSSKVGSFEDFGTIKKIQNYTDPFYTFVSASQIQSSSLSNKNDFGLHGYSVHKSATTSSSPSLTNIESSLPFYSIPSVHSNVQDLVCESHKKRDYITPKNITTSTQHNELDGEKAYEPEDDEKNTNQLALSDSNKEENQNKPLEDSKKQDLTSAQRQLILLSYLVRNRITDFPEESLSTLSNEELKKSNQMRTESSCSFASTSSIQKPDEDENSSLCSEDDSETSSSLDEELIEKLCKWNPSSMTIDEISYDRGYQCDGCVESTVAEFQKVRMVNRWRRYDTKLAENDVDSLERECKESDCLEKDERGKDGIEVTDDKEEPNAMKAKEVEEEDEEALRSKQRLSVIKKEINEAKQHYWMYGEWVRKEWMSDESEAEMWNKAERSIKKEEEETERITGVAKKGVFNVQTLEEMKSCLKDADELGLSEKEIRALNKIVQKAEKKARKRQRWNDLTELERFYLSNDREKEKRQQSKLNQAKCVEADSLQNEGEEASNESIMECIGKNIEPFSSFPSSLNQNLANPQVCSLLYPTITNSIEHPLKLESIHFHSSFSSSDHIQQMPPLPSKASLSSSIFQRTQSQTAQSLLSSLLCTDEHSKCNIMQRNNSLLTNRIGKASNQISAFHNSLSKNGLNANSQNYSCSSRFSCGQVLHSSHSAVDEQPFQVQLKLSLVSNLPLKYQIIELDLSERVKRQPHCVSKFQRKLATHNFVLPQAQMALREGVIMIPFNQFFKLQKWKSRRMKIY